MCDPRTKRGSPSGPRPEETCSGLDSTPPMGGELADGPDPVWTSELSALLADEDVRATFFALGCSISSETRPILRGALTAGHDIGNHTFSHPSFAQPSLSDASASDEIVRTHVLLNEI